jgi:hypothetical protein
MHALSRSITSRPVITSAHTMLANEEIFGVIDVLVRARLYAVDHLPASSVGKGVLLQPSERTLGSRSIRIALGMYLVSSLCRWSGQHRLLLFSSLANLVEEDVLAIPTFGREILEISILIDPMLLAQLLPELTANYVTYSSASAQLRLCRKLEDSSRTIVAALASLDRDDFSVRGSAHLCSSPNRISYLGILSTSGYSLNDVHMAVVRDALMETRFSGGRP